jgi:transcriptional regulator with XRE-family HTH domain
MGGIPFRHLLIAARETPNALHAAAVDPPKYTLMMRSISAFIDARLPRLPVGVNRSFRKIRDNSRMPHKPTLGERIKIARKSAGITQGELARRISTLRGEKLSRAAVSKWEKDQVSTMEMENIFAAADVTEINARWLALGTGTPVRWVNLTPEESHLIEMFRALAQDYRDRLIGVASAFPPSESAPTKGRPFQVSPPAHKPAGRKA